MRGRAAGTRPEGEGGTAGLAVLKNMGPALAEEEGVQSLQVEPHW